MSATVAAFFAYAADLAEATAQVDISSYMLLRGVMVSTCDACDGDRLPLVTAEEAEEIQKMVNDRFANRYGTTRDVVDGLRLLAAEVAL